MMYLVTEHRPPSRDAAHRDGDDRRQFDARGSALGVAERPARYGVYEAEGSERRALGSVSVTGDSHWNATLTVPMTGGAAFVHVERRGALPPGYRGGEESCLLTLPVGELDALLVLLRGVVDQARSDGVVSGPSSG